MFLHQKNLVHRDLKLENIVLESEDSLKIKIVDLGILGQKDEDETNIGSLHYMAPEILKEEMSNTDTPLDVWSLGIILYLLLFGSFPFKGKTR